MSHANNPFTVARRTDLVSTTPLTTNIVCGLLTLALVSLLLVSIFFIIRRRRRARIAASLTLPLHKLDADLPESPLQLQPPPIPARSRHRRTPSTLSLNFSASGPHPPVLVYQEKQDYRGTSPSPPSSPIPEIRLTFPDEIDDDGKPRSGRVVVVHIGEHGEGLSPLNEELPLYQKEVTEQFHEVDLSSVGGLREK